MKSGDKLRYHLLMKNMVTNIDVLCVFAKDGVTSDEDDCLVVTLHGNCERGKDVEFF